MRASGFSRRALADYGLGGRGQSEERWQRDHGGNDPAEGAEREAAGKRDQRKDGHSADGERTALVKAAGAAAIGFAAQRAHDAAASSDEQARRSRHPGIGVPTAHDDPRRDWWNATNSVIAAAAAATMSQVRRRIREVGNGAPEKIDGVREREQGADAGRTRRVNSLIAQEIRERAADKAEGDDRIGRDEDAEEPGALVRHGL